MTIHSTLLVQDFLSHYIFSILEEYSKNSNDHARQADGNHVKKEEERILDDSKETFIL